MALLVGQVLFLCRVAFLSSSYAVWRTVYVVAISLFGVTGVIVSCFPVFSTPRFRTIRTGNSSQSNSSFTDHWAAFFLVFGFFAVFPVPHLLYLNGIENMLPILGLEALMGALYTIGALIYSSRIPERYYPGKLDFTVVASP